jgi:hypothetical protein
MDQAKVVSLCRALVRLVDEPQQGLASWHAMCARTVDELRAELAVERTANARFAEQVLWAIRVLDEHDDLTGKRTRWEPFTGRSISGPGEICPNDGIRYSGNSRAEASVSAARSVFRSLSSAASAALGECP